MPNPRKVEDVERQLESVSKALKEREKKYVCYWCFLDLGGNADGGLCLGRQGASVEEMVQEVNKATGNLEKVEKELKQMSALNKVR